MGILSGLTMGLLRTFVIVFVAGWVFWFWLDKESPAQLPPQAGPGYGHPRMPAPPGYPGYPGHRAVPPEPADGSLVQEFQYTVDLLKLGRYEHAFVYIWRRESWIVAGVVSVLLSFVLSSIVRAAARRRRRSSYPQPVPARRGESDGGEDGG